MKNKEVIIGISFKVEGVEYNCQYYVPCDVVEQSTKDIKHHEILMVHITEAISIYKKSNSITKKTDEGSISYAPHYLP